VQVHERHATAALAFAYFIVGTGAFVIAGLLNEIAVDLEVSAAAAGQLITAYALALAVGAPLLASLVSRFDRRILIAIGLGLFGLLHFVAASAPAYGWLAATRVMCGLAAAIATPQAIAAADQIAQPERRGRTLATVFLGFSFAIVLGVPAGTVLGATLGWRVSLVLIGSISLFSALWIVLALPATLSQEPADAGAWRKLVSCTAILWVLTTTVLQTTGQFTLYTYFAPVFESGLRAGARTIGLLFGAFGLFGLIGTAIARRLLDPIGSGRVVILCLSLVAVAFALWPLTAGSITITLFVLLLWGVGGFAVHPSQQARLVTIAPALASVSISLNLSATYLGQALGGAIGGGLIGTFGTAVLSWVGLLVLLASIGAAWMANRAEVTEERNYRKEKRVHV
jgi:predicted MFS family arabinose efflux permease